MAIDNTTGAFVFVAEKFADARRHEIATGVCGTWQRIGLQAFDSQLGSRRESVADPLQRDFGGVQFFPRCGERGRLEEAPAGSNQQQKWVVVARDNVAYRNWRIRNRAGMRDSSRWR